MRARPGPSTGASARPQSGGCLEAVGSQGLKKSRLAFGEAYHAHSERDKAAPNNRTSARACLLNSSALATLPPRIPIFDDSAILSRPPPIIRWSLISNPQTHTSVLEASPLTPTHHSSHAPLLSNHQSSSLVPNPHSSPPMCRRINV